MASAWGKFLAPVTITTALDFDWEDPGSQSATLASGTYDTVLHAAAALETSIKATTALSSVNISEAGICTIAIDNMTAVVWSSTALANLLGFDQTEAIVSESVTGSTPHEEGWYPGVISYGVTRGEGLDADDSWRVVDKAGELVAGSGNMRKIVQARRVYRRDLSFPVVGRTEALKSRKKGPKAFEDKWSTSVIWWYPDRSAGAVGSYGTQIDPADYTTDDDGDYYKVKVIGSPSFRVNSKSPEYYMVRLPLHAEPD